MFKENSIELFLESVADATPTPGGGTVSALLGSLSSSLVSMVYGLTINKKKFLALDEEIKNKIISAQDTVMNIKNELLVLMDEDSKAFNLVMEGFKMPKNDEVEKLLRDVKIQLGYNKSMEVAFKTATVSYKLYDYIELACDYGNINAITDVGVATLTLQSAIEGAILNVRVNASALEEDESIRSILDGCSKYVKGSRERRDMIIEKVEGKISM